MRRAPWVIGATGLGLGLVLSYHTQPLHVASIGASAGAGSGSQDGTSTTTRPSGSTGSTSTSGGDTSSGTTAPTTPTTATPPTTTGSTRSATSQDVQYQYGDLQLKVTETGHRITKIQIVSEGASDPRSAEINSQALPFLQQQAMSAQSANIDGVSGATFTSAAYDQALQSALDQLGS